VLHHEPAAQLHGRRQPLPRAGVAAGLVRVVRDGDEVRRVVREQQALLVRPRPGAVVPSPAEGDDVVDLPKGGTCRCRRRTIPRRRPTGRSGWRRKPVSGMLHRRTKDRRSETPVGGGQPRHSSRR
jgi:hypothetical protein